MYPFANLPDNLAAFCGALRRCHDFRIGAGELLDAARALDAVNLADERQVRNALRPVLSATREHAAAFDAAFARYFFPGPAGAGQPDHVALPRSDRGAGDRGESAAPAPDGRPRDSTSEDWQGATAGVRSQGDPGPVTDDEAAMVARAQYSPLAAEGRTTLIIEPPGDDWLDAARSLLRAIRTGLSRRWRIRPRGRRFDLRRTWRASLQTGGDPIAPRWLGRITRTPRVVLLIDGSRSMTGAEQPAMTLAVALAAVSRRIEVFVFSTALGRVTPLVRQAARHRVRLDLPGEVWGGGTAIGACLQEYVRTHGERGIARDALVMIASDGLDVGDPDALSRAMRHLHTRAAGVAWLNPLVDTPGYQPTARGMLAALPFISTFAAVSTPADVQRLSRRLRVRR
jgi:uncharacterized protein with von Willebrand factor type A (vWA) domain